MIGYTYGQQAYKLLDIECRTIISSRHIIFDETRSVSEVESAPWNDPTVKGQCEGLLPEHLCRPEHNHDDDNDDGQCPPNPRPVGDPNMAQEDAPKQPASPIIQELAKCLAQLHLDVPAAPAIPAIPAPIPAPAWVVAGVQHSGWQQQQANKNKEYQQTLEEEAER